MSQRPYFRDIWTCGTPNNGYPGSFPRGLISMIRKKWWGKDRLWLFSGSFSNGSDITIDIKYELRPTIQADCGRLPLRSASFDFVMADPPYSEKESLEMYEVPYFSFPSLMNEMSRVCKDGGYAILLHRLIPERGPWFGEDFKRLELQAIVGIHVIGGISNIRALTVWRKGNSLHSWI